uniref:Uncharacterized LOC102552424 n=1 Tax=Rattus norvegicus TaxID=10116 RepID=A0A8I5ZVD2_RAT
MSVRNEEENKEQTVAEVIPHIQEHRYLTMLALSCFVPVGYIALFCFLMTRSYIERKEYEKAKATSRYTLFFATVSIFGGLVFLLSLFRFLLK